MTTPLLNWAGTHTFTAPRLHRPESIADLQRIVAASGHARALGTAHSFNAIADTDGDLIAVSSLPPTIELDAAARTVRVAAGVRYGELSGHLDAAGFALANLGSLPHISVAGACSTGTHGSGVGNGVLATSVRAIELVGPGGDLVVLDRGSLGDDFAGAVVALGLLGIVTHLTLAVEPTYQVQQEVVENLPYAAVREHFDDVMAAGYSVSLLTSWRDDVVDQVWVKRRLDAPTGRDLRELGATAATVPHHPVPGEPGEQCTVQLGIPGPWHERLPHFRLNFTPSKGEEIQSEYFVPREQAVDALDAVRALGTRLGPLLLVSEIRTVAADDLWLSPAYRRDSVAIHFTLVRDMAAVLPLLGEVEAALAPFDPRPHWGKVFTTAPETVRAAYPRLGDFRRLRDRLDPAGVFGNHFTSEVIGR